MTSLRDLPLRPSLVGQEPYGAPQLHVRAELNVNENTFGIPEPARDDIAESLAAVVHGLNRYPDREFTELRQQLAAYLGHGITERQVWAANGSNEVLQQVLQAFGGPGRSLLSFGPTYSMYPLLASGTETRYIDIARDPDFSITPEAAAQAVREHHPDVVFVCDPNNPTGTLLPIDVIEAVYEAAPGIVLVDEAYWEFAGVHAPTALDLLPGRERLLVSRTMSKAFAFAGVRLGYLAADPAVTDALRLVRLPYHLSALTQAAALAALRHSEAMLATVRQICAERDRIVTETTRLGYRPFASSTNFVLIGGIADPEATFSGLLERGVLVRNNGIPHTLRVTAGTHEETTAFLDGLEAVGAPLGAEHETQAR